MEEDATVPSPDAWHLVWDEGMPTILDQHDNVIATVAQSSQETMLARASLLMAATHLYGMVTTTLELFQVMAEQGDGRFAAAARDMIPYLEEAVDHANFVAPVTPEMLVGS